VIGEHPVSTGLTHSIVIAVAAYVSTELCLSIVGRLGTYFDSIKVDFPLTGSTSLL